MKFDRVIGNPPYQKSTGTGNPIWQHFVEFAIDRLLKKKGFLSLVHPALWRKPQSNSNTLCSSLKSKLFEKNILFLNINGVQKGESIFDAGTRFDWYVIKNLNNSSYTNIIDEENNYISIKVNEWPWLPNHSFELIENFLAKSKNKKTEILYNRSSYDPRNEIMSYEKKGKYKYPVVHTTPKSGVRFCYSSRNDLGHFGVSKVIIGDSGVENAIIDIEGKYGMTHHAMGFPVNNQREAKLIKKALLTDKFQRVLNACSWSNFQIDFRMFQDFRKDWYKVILDE